MLCFHNCQPGSNVPDPRTLHTGTAVIKGEKWAVNKWVRERRIRLNYETEADPSSVHLGMKGEEILELIAEMDLEAALAVLDEECVALPEGGMAGGGADGGEEQCRQLLRVHFGLG